MASASPDPGSRKTSRASTSTTRLLIAGVIAIATVSAVLFKSGRSPRPVSPTARDGRLLSVAGTPIQNQNYVGSASCQECHPGEHAQHGSSGHSRTLRRAMNPSASGLVHDRKVRDPELPEIDWHFEREDHGLIARRLGTDAEKFRLDLAIGSGEHAMTFVSLFDRPQPASAALEFRISYFKGRDVLDLTPGHTIKNPGEGMSDRGFILTNGRLMDCLSCHSTPTLPIPLEKSSPSTLIPNVSCERCHGPGREHIALARRGVEDLDVFRMPFGHGRWTAPEQLRLCGSCHRLPGMVPLSTVTPENLSLVRFPSVGISQSACYLKSQGAFSCTTCHDPHARASSDAAGYDTTCMSCHSRTEDRPDGLLLPVVASLCSVQPRSDCVSCHMPKRNVGHGLAFSDHWLRRIVEGPSSLNQAKSE